MQLFINLVYILSSVMFVFGLKMLSSPATARRGNMLSAGGMGLAVIVTLFDYQVISWQYILIGVVIGGLIGFASARLVGMTSMPEMVALLNGSGGFASLLLGWAEFQRGWTVVQGGGEQLSVFTASVIALAILIGGVTTSGSVIAWAKLSEKIGGKPVLFPGQQVFNVILLIVIVACGIMFSINPGASYAYTLIIALIVLALVLGVMSVIPIGGADMPVVISLLNSYSGLAACAAGFVIINNVLIVAGALVGASGIILTNIMCKAMNRSLANVLFSGFGATTSGAGKQAEGEVKSVSAEDAYFILEAATSVAFVPGYGLAVAQAQHVVRELGELLEDNGAEVRYAVHPVAGRMPGHMNVLLAEANVPYDQLAEMEEVNPNIEMVDVCVVVGANDVVNPAAREDNTSPLFGMPIIDVDKSRTVIVLKRSMNPGFAGVQNPLFFKENTRMLFGDAKDSIQGLVREFKDA